MSETITLTMTREHAQVVKDACEMLMRLKLGQPSFATEELLGFPNSDSMDMREWCLRRDVANDLLRTYLRVVGNPVGTPKDDVEHMAYEVWGTIRSALYMHDNPDGGNGWSVASQPPLAESGLKMPKCEIKEDA